MLLRLSEPSLSPPLIFPRESTGIWGVIFCLCSRKGRRFEFIHGPLMTLYALLWTERSNSLHWWFWSETLASAPGVYGSRHSCVFFTSTFMLFALTPSLWKLTHSFLNTFSFPLGQMGTLWFLSYQVQITRRQNLDLGLTHLNLSCSLPMELLSCHTESSFGWSTDCPRGLQLPPQSDLENELFPWFLYATTYLLLCS